MRNDYWGRVLGQRISRRRAIAATSASAAAAAFLAACGGSSSNGGSSSGTAGAGSDLLAKVEDTTKDARRGGTMKWIQASEPLHFDGQAQGQAQLNIYNGMVYEALVRNKPGIGQPSTFTEVLPNLAESWELSPDKTQITFKLRQGVKWQNVPPLNGRPFDSSDVIESVNRYVNHPTANNATANFNSKNPSAPILSVTAPDAKTVVYKLKEPASYIMQRIANMITGELGAIYPKETDHGFDARKGQIGTGGFILDKYTPSAGITYRRNPDYWNKDAVYTDVLDIPFQSQYAARLGQLRAGAVYAPPFGIRLDILPEDIMPTKRDVPALNLYSVVSSSNNTSFIQRFGWKDLNGRKAPWLDVRVRQAMSMALDRDGYIDAFYNVSGLQKDGLPVDIFYHTSMGYIPGVTLDPRDKSFGENAKYYTHDLTEAKKLLSAAGFPNGFEYTNHWPNFPAFGPAFPKQMAVIESFNSELGLKVSSDPIDYNLKYLPDYVTKRGQHEGVVVTLGAVTSPDPTDYYVWRYYSKSGATSGAIFGDVGSGAGEGDPKVDDFIEKAKAEFDAKKQATILGDLQRYLAQQQYCVTSPGIATAFDMAWPAVRNYLVNQGDSRAINAFYYTWWLDDSKEPLKKV